MRFLLSAQSGANALKTHTQCVTVRTRHLVDLQSREEKTSPNTHKHPPEEISETE